MTIALIIAASNLRLVKSQSTRALIIGLCCVAGLVCTIVVVMCIVNILSKRQNAKEALREAEQARQANSQTEQHRTARVVNGVIYSGVSPATGRVCAVGSLDAIVNEGADAQNQEAASRVMESKKTSQLKRMFGSWRRVRADPIDCESLKGIAPATKTETEPALAKKTADEKKENIFVAFWGFLKSWARVERSA